MIDDRRSGVRALAAAIGLAVVVTGCALGTTTVVLLPEQDGRKSVLGVTDSRGEIALDRPYAAVHRTPIGSQAYQSTPDEVKSMFGAALAAQPRRDVAFTLYFAQGGDEIGDESRAPIDAAMAEIGARPVTDVMVIGHADGVGSDLVNDALARRRADAVRVELIRRGVAPGDVSASARGSREPLVPVPAGTSEPRNRRVEIIVR